MKKLVKGFIATLLTIGVLSGAASAATTVTTCTISNTGPGSFNSCYDSTTDQSILACTTNIGVINTNVQTGTSGTATVNGNTTGGGAASGTVANSSDIQTALNVLGCGTVAVAPTTPTPPVGGQGGGEVAQAATPAPVAKPVALPKTGTNDVVNEAVTGLAIVAGTLAVSQLGIQAYRRFALK